MWQRILVALDGSPAAESILPAIAGLARQLDAVVTLLHVKDPPEESRRADYPPVLEQLLQNSRGHAETYLTRIAQRLKRRAVRVQIAVAFGEPAPEILAYAHREQADLIALTTHARSGIDRWILGSVAEAVVHESTTPVFLARPEAMSGSRMTRFARVLVPLDGLPRGESAVAAATALAGAVGLPLTLVQVAETPYFTDEPPGIAAFDTSPWVDDYLLVIRSYVESFATAARQNGTVVDIVVASGQPSPSIIQEAARVPGTLVVMGSYGRTGVAGTLFGSVARDVVQRGGGTTVIVRSQSDT